ncbi:MAG: TetR/AcrR family transcriptional regulator [Clostridia bacterium]|nr:TetR/AcrR family transcriptional regulator [Clostridia bacterium]
MAEHHIYARQARVRSRVLHAAAALFLQKGYVDSTLREIAERADVKYGSLTFAFGSKEQLLAELVGLVIDGQFEAAWRLLGKEAGDPLLLYAAEITLQLYMAESSEHMRELYSLSYSLPSPSAVVYEKITFKLKEFFGKKYPDFTAADFYEKELAAAGVMRNYLTRPADVFFPMERKVKAFLENTLLLYEVPREEREALFTRLGEIDFAAAAGELIHRLPAYLESRT